MPIQNALASLAVADIVAATHWYTVLFGRAADSQPMPEVAEWKFSNGGWLQIYRGPERAGKGSVTLAVTNLEEQVAELEKLGINKGISTTDTKVKTYMIADPDGNHIAFAEASDSSMAH